MRISSTLYLSRHLATQSAERAWPGDAEPQLPLQQIPYSTHVLPTCMSVNQLQVLENSSSKPPLFQLYLSSTCFMEWSRCMHSVGRNATLTPGVDMHQLVTPDKFIECLRLQCPWRWEQQLIGLNKMVYVHMVPSKQKIIHKCERYYY